jgi:ubiquinone/menaquinone biosynthesis C-methylase UbiE
MPSFAAREPRLTYEMFDDERDARDGTRADDSAIARAYDRWAGQYDADDNATRDLDAAELRALSLSLRGLDVLELGCGTGKNTAWLATQAASVIAADFSGRMLARARQRVSARSVCFVAFDVREPWPIIDRSVDLVLFDLVLEHVQTLEPVYREAARVLRPGGHLRVSELHPFRQLLGGQAHFIEEQTGEMVMVPAFRHSMSEYINAAIAAGLGVGEIGEPLERGARADAPPRLLTILLARP